VRSPVRELVLGGAIAAAVFACTTGTKTTQEGTQPVVQPPPPIPMDPRITEINGRMDEIRAQRGRMGLRMDPSNDLIREARTYSTKAQMCPDNEPDSGVCEDTCRVAQDICDNADYVCNLSDQLAKSPHHKWAVEKCASARASCKEASQKCCGCNEDHQDDAAESGTW